MPAKVTLTVLEGRLAGECFEYDGRATCLVGRSKECQLRLPNETDEDRKASRHHCLLDINPPDARIRDLGSRNGTRVNGKLIGRRKKDQSREEGAQVRFREHDLQHDDEIKIGRARFRVDIYAPAYCAGCDGEIPPQLKPECERSPGVFLCGACRTNEEPAASQIKRAGQCAQCGRDVSDEVGSQRQGDYVCAACQGDPFQVLNRLLELAKTGDGDLRAIKEYEVERCLGKGGMGAVYLARHPATRQRVALKVMLPQVAATERSRKLFLREIKNTAALDHRHVVKLLDYGCSRGTFFFTLQLCNRGGVDRLLKKNQGTLPVRRAVDITLDVLEGLVYAHNVELQVELDDGSTQSAIGLVHRDLSPHNILLAGDAEAPIAKVSDFGLAKAFDTAGLSGLTRTGSASGKPFFMPRQQVINYRDAKPEVDVWAAAACLYQMITGRVPRVFLRDQDPWITVLETKPVPIRKRDASVPKRLAQVIDAALVEEPEICFQSADEFRRELERAL